MQAIRRSSRCGRLIWAIGAYLFLRSILAFLPGYAPDLGAYRRWAQHAARDGLTQVYQTTDIDYPPLYAYLLWPLGKLSDALSPEVLAMKGKSILRLMKLPPLLFDLALGILLYRFARRWEGEGRTGPPIRLGSCLVPWSLFLPALYLLNPAVLFDTGYWGEPDSVHSFFVLAAFLVLGAGRVNQSAWPAWVLLTLATLMKPLAAPYFPLLFALSYAWCGLVPTLAGMSAALATAALVVGPFVLANGPALMMERLVGDVGAMPFTSSNAHNLWWALGAWRNAETPWLGPLSSTQVGFGLFAALLAAILWTGYRRHRREPGGLAAPEAYAFALLLGLGFFVLATHMHENHMFLVLPLALPLLPFETDPRRPMLKLYGALSVGVLLNLVLHDLTIPNRWPFTLGGPSTVLNLHLMRPFHQAELWAIRFSVAWNLACFVLTTGWVLRRDGRGLLDAVSGSPHPAHVA